MSTEIDYVKEIQAHMPERTPAARERIAKAYAFADKAHANQKRLSGDPYIMHLGETALALSKMGMDTTTIVAGLLHDTIEDTEVSSEELEKEFGAEVRFLVEGVTKLGELKYRGFEQRAESLRRLLVATAKDVRVIIIKLFDRLHNMETIRFQDPERQKRKALETLEIYAPLADRLGMSVMKRELEDYCFPAIDKEAYDTTVELSKHKATELQEGLHKVQKEIQHTLARKNMKKFKTEIRVKGLWSLYQKLKRKGNDIDKIHDIAALRIIVESIADCYTVLGIIHSLYKPIPGEFKDYISNEKPNGYKSIHTTVITREAGIVEIQIRTAEMHQQAQYGIASHMTYKQLGKSAPKDASQGLSLTWATELIPSLLNFNAKKKENVNDVTPAWLKELADSHASLSDSSDFVEGLKKDFLSYRVFVFTPQGDVVDLPHMSSPIDFAYAIHSDLGNHMQGAKVNGKLVSFDTELHNGDVVEIVAKDSGKPNAKWLEHAKTSLARNHIRRELESIAQKTRNGALAGSAQFRKMKKHSKR